MAPPSMSLSVPRAIPEFEATAYPICREGRAPPHVFVLPELASSVVAREVGDDRISLSNAAPTPVFARTGTRFACVGGHSWKTLTDALVPGRSTTVVRAECIHSSLALQIALRLDAAVMWIPVPCQRAARERPHGRAAVADPHALTAPPGSPRDLQVLEPAHEQVGLMTYGRHGLVGFEAFRDEATWRAYGDDVTREHLQAAARQEARTSLETPPEALLRLVNDVLSDGPDDRSGVELTTHDGEVLRVAWYP